MRVMSKILRDEGKRVSDEVIDIDELPDARRLPPLPTDDDYDEYYDDEILGTLNHDEMPASEEELQGKEWPQTCFWHHLEFCRVHPACHKSLFSPAGVAECL
ncbi:hypothetical protein Y032_0229g2903 [Ancylostoma ceylanicum]|uniref:Uncharacterized protein n=1 Tax=Ancylostoma ceylanicum TaxID=53326 RepID=A0A016SH62_9BILA|nr:hypothetical protein Y032_0229g2903 [Ancylostoma ceylanicum]